MKKIFFSFAISVIIFNAYSQTAGFRYGATFGLGTSDFKPAGGITSTADLGILGGFTANKQFTKNFGLNLNALFVKKGAEVTGKTLEPGGFLTADQYYPYTDVFRLYYAELPLLAKLSFGINSLYLKGFAGPSLNFHLLARQERTYDDEHYNNKYGFKQKLNGSEVTEFSFVYGFGLEVENKSNDVFFVDFRFSNSLTPFNELEKGDDKTVKVPVYNKYFGVTLGYMYNYE